MPGDVDAARGTSDATEFEPVFPEEGASGERASRKQGVPAAKAWICHQNARMSVPVRYLSTQPVADDERFRRSAGRRRKEQEGPHTAQLWNASGYRQV